MDCVEQLGTLWLLLIKLLREIWKDGKVWLFALGGGACLALLLFVGILGISLYYCFHKRRKVRLAPSKNNFVDNVTNNMTRKAHIPVEMSQDELIHNDANSLTKVESEFTEVDLHNPGDYETIFPLPGRPIKEPSTFPRPLKPPRTPRKKAQNAPDLDQGVKLQGSGYIEVTEADGAQYLTIRESLEVGVDEIAQDDVEGQYIGMDNIQSPQAQGGRAQGGAQGRKKERHNAVDLDDDGYMGMQGMKTDDTYAPMEANLANLEYVPMEGNLANIETKEGNDYLEMKPHDGPAQCFAIKRTGGGEFIALRDNPGNSDYTGLRNTTRVQSDAYYISIKPDGRISWASDDDGYLRPRYPSENEGGVPTPSYITNTQFHNYDSNKTLPW